MEMYVYCIDTYIYCIHSTGWYVHQWCSHRLHTMRLSLPLPPGNTLF